MKKVIHEILATGTVVEDKEKGFKVLAYNTSLMTPYQIAKSVLKELNELEEKGEFIL